MPASPQPQPIGPAQAPDSLRSYLTGHLTGTNLDGSAYYAAFDPGTPILVELWRPSPAVSGGRGPLVAEWEGSWEVEGASPDDELGAIAGWSVGPEQIGGLPPGDYPIRVRVEVDADAGVYIEAVNALLTVGDAPAPAYSDPGAITVADVLAAAFVRSGGMLAKVGYGPEVVAPGTPFASDLLATALGYMGVTPANPFRVVDADLAGVAMGSAVKLKDLVEWRALESAWHNYTLVDVTGANYAMANGQIRKDLEAMVKAKAAFVLKVYGVGSIGGQAVLSGCVRPPVLPVGLVSPGFPSAVSQPGVNPWTGGRAWPNRGYGWPGC